MLALLLQAGAVGPRIPADTALPPTRLADAPLAIIPVLQAARRPNPEILAPLATAAGLADTVRRPRAIEYSNGYATRLTIHRIASYATLPLFAAELYTGEKLYNAESHGDPPPSFAKSVHPAIAGGLAGLFAVNTVTGVWNLLESKHDPAGRTRRWAHSILMLTSDAGFAATGIAAGNASRSQDSRNTHRTLALTSMGVATAGYLMMLVWKQ